MEELLINLLEQSVAFAVLAVAWRLAENRYTTERSRNDELQDRYLKHFEEEHPVIEKAGE